jgi:plastocyanin
MKRVLVTVGLFTVLAGGTAAAQNWLTLPAADSFVGGAPFFSDVRAFNTSYSASLVVTATYHCFIPSPCTAGTPSVTFTLAPRESHAFDDMVLNTFNAPDTAGGIEFGYAGTQDQLVVTSRLFSTQPEPTVGMFIPGLPDSEAFTTTVLTSVRNGGSGPSFRTNVGVYNRTATATAVTFTVFDGGTNQVGNPVTINVGAHAGAQVNQIFGAAGDAGHETQNGVVVVSSSQPIFSYAAVIDNHTTDPIFVVGASDQPQQPITPVATNTPSEGNPTATPAAPTATPAAPTATPTPPAGATRTVNVGQGGNAFVDAVSGNSTSNITVGTTVHWVFVASAHSTTSGPCPPCSGDGTWDSGIKTSGSFDHTFSTAGSFVYFCRVHNQEMTGTVTVAP